MASNIKICILSELAYSLLAGKGIRGGAELQMTILAKELVKRSYDVSFVTFEKPERSIEMIEGIKVYNPFDIRNSGYSYLYPHYMSRLLKILKMIDADIYIQRATTPLTGVVGFFTNLNNKLFLYSASSDNDVSDNLQVKSVEDLKNMVFRFGVKHCDMVICQSSQQKNLLKKTLGKEGMVIKNFYSFPKTAQNIRNLSNKRILWVGRMRKEKRPDLFLKLANFFPDYNFLMIGGPSSAHPEYYAEIRESAGSMSNLDFMGLVPHNEMEKFYSESMLLVNTSPSEGFPNTFLEAWGNCIPVVSLGFDPDEIICKNNLGLHSKTFDQMVDGIKNLLKNEKLREEMGINSRSYVEEEHNVDKLVSEYEKVFELLLKMGE